MYWLACIDQVILNAQIDILWMFWPWRLWRRCFLTSIPCWCAWMAWIMRRTALRRRPTPRGCWTGSRRLGSLFFLGWEKHGKTMDFMAIHGDLTKKMGIWIGITLGNFRGCHGKWPVHPCVDDKSILEFSKLVLRVYLKSERKTWQIWCSFTFSLLQEWRWFSGNNRDGTLGNCSGIKFITTLVNHKRSIRSMICMFAFVTRVGKMRFLSAGYYRPTLLHRRWRLSWRARKVNLRATCLHHEFPANRPWATGVLSPKNPAGTQKSGIFVELYKSC